MNSTCSREDELFAEWREKRPGLVADGMVDEDAFCRSSPKLLFVLKEVKDVGGGGWDLREFLREGGRADTWDNITRWVEGIHLISEDLSWDELYEVDQARRQRTLRTIAAIYLKKSPGGHTTDSATLAKIAEEDKTFLNRQLSHYEPDIIVCCGTSDLFHWLVPISEHPQWRTTRRGVSYHEYRLGQYVVAYSHPQARCASHILYYGLVDAIREILIGNQFTPDQSQ